MTTMQVPAASRRDAKVRLLTRDHLDGRTRAHRLFNEISRGVASDLGGEDRISVVQKHLIEAFSSVCVHLSALNVKLLQGEDVDIIQHSQAISTLVRVASRLGVTRVPREVESLDQYLKRAQPEMPDDVDDADDEVDDT